MPPAIAFGSSFVGEDRPVYFIAEAGVNHNGDIDMAKRLIDEAASIGADAVKFQTFKAKDIVTKYAPKAAYQKQTTNEEESQFDMLKRLELSYEDHIILKEHCEKVGITFCSTPHSSTKDVDLLEKLGVPFYKVGSGDLTNLPILDYIARTGKPIILSSGMASMDEIREAITTVKEAGNDKIILLHCTTSYPAPDESINLLAIQTLRDEFDMLIGYSDHTSGIHVPTIAAAIGAVLIEKHFTLDKTLPGPDQKASCEPTEIGQTIKCIHSVENRGFSAVDSIKLVNSQFGLSLSPDIGAILGDGKKKPHAIERDIANVTRKSIVAKQALGAGTILSRDMFVIKRPGNGMHPRYLLPKFDNVSGKILSRDLAEDEQLQESDLQ